MPKKHKEIHQREQVVGKKQPRTVVDQEGYLRKHPVWSFKLCDTIHDRWSIGKCSSIYKEIIEKLISYEGMTWAEIQASSGGKSAGHGTNNHFENISDLCAEAQKRANEIHLLEDQLFSLRLTGRSRLYGVLSDGTFSLIWYDTNHEICPMKNK